MEEVHIDMKDWILPPLNSWEANLIKTAVLYARNCEPTDVGKTWFGDNILLHYEGFDESLCWPEYRRRVAMGRYPGGVSDLEVEVTGGWLEKLPPGTREVRHGWKTNSPEPDHADVFYAIYRIPPERVEKKREMSKKPGFLQGVALQKMQEIMPGKMTAEEMKTVHFVLRAHTWDGLRYVGGRLRSGAPVGEGLVPELTGNLEEANQFGTDRVGIGEAAAYAEKTRATLKLSRREPLELVEVVTVVMTRSTGFTYAGLGEQEGRHEDAH